MKDSKLFLLPILFCFFLLSFGCASRLQPDLKRLYSQFRNEPKERPVILIPGAMGSKLVNRSNDRSVWPGGLLNLLTGSRIDELQLPVTKSGLAGNNDPLEPSVLVGKMANQNFYGKIVTTLTDMGGYNCSYPSEITSRTDCVLFPWDWRRDLTKSVGQLDKLIEKLRTVNENPELKVNIVAHSAGGLLTRYYVRFGKRDVLSDSSYKVTLDGAEKIGKVVLVATPNFGSIPALQRAVVGQEIGFTEVTPEILATMPGLYQTLPHPDRTFMIDVNGHRIERDLYDLSTWKKYEWSIFDPDIRDRIKTKYKNPQQAQAYLKAFENYMSQSLTRARRFHEALSVSLDQVPVKYIVFGSSCILTPSVCLIEKVDGKPKIRLYPNQVVNRKESVNYEKLMMAPGDGTVTKASLLAREKFGRPTRSTTGSFPIDYSVFLCEQHATYPSNTTFQDNLLTILLY